MAEDSQSSQKCIAAMSSGNMPFADLERKLREKTVSERKKPQADQAVASPSQFTDKKPKSGHQDTRQAARPSKPPTATRSDAGRTYRPDEDLFPFQTISNSKSNRLREAQDEALFLAAVEKVQPYAKEASRSASSATGRQSAVKKQREHAPGAACNSVFLQPSPAGHFSTGKDDRNHPPSSFLDNTGQHQISAGQHLVSSGQAAAPNPPEPAILTEEEKLFSAAMNEVTPLTARGRDIPLPPRQTAKPPSAGNALADFLAGKLEFALHHTDEYMEGFVVGIDPAVPGKLRAGAYSPEAHLDLHGQNSTQALDALIHFIKHAYHRNMRTVLVITGRGKNSPGGVSIIRNQLQEWFTKEPFKRVVLAFCTARPMDGGPGAVYVLLRKFKKSRGKIRWEVTPPADELPKNIK